MTSNSTSGTDLRQKLVQRLLERRLSQGRLQNLLRKHVLQKLLLLLGGQLWKSQLLQLLLLLLRQHCQLLLLLEGFGANLGLSGALLLE